MINILKASKILKNGNISKIETDIGIFNYNSKEDCFYIDKLELSINYHFELKNKLKLYYKKIKYDKSKL